jgi:hypothetical protein
MPGGWQLLQVCTLQSNVQLAYYLAGSKVTNGTFPHMVYVSLLLSAGLCNG